MTPVTPVNITDFLNAVKSSPKPRFMTLCPWHDDHSPSLSVDREKGVYHCFGCGVSGRLASLEGNGRINHIHMKTAKVYMINPTTEEVYRHRKALPSKHQCGQWTRKGYLDKKLVKAVRLLCFEWDCPQCYPRLKAWWKGRIMRDADRHSYTVILPLSLSISPRIRRLRRLAAVAQRGVEYCLIKGANRQYLFLSGWLAATPGVIWDLFPEAERVVPFGDPTTRDKLLEEALSPEFSPLNRGRKLRLSRKFLFTEYWAKVEKKLQAEIAKGEPPGQPAPPKIDWVIQMRTLEEVVAEEVAQGRTPTWLSHDLVTFV